MWKIVGAAVAAVWVLASATSALGQTPSPRSDRERLQGGWVQTVVQDPGPPAPGPRQPADSVVLFTSDGGVMTQLNSANPPGLVATGGAGAWVRTGPNRFAVTQKFAVASVDAGGGVTVGFFVQRLSLHYGPSDDELEGEGDFALVDPGGNVLFAGPPFSVVLHRVLPQAVGSPF